MLQVSRANNLKIPKTIENISGNLNRVDDKVAVKQAIATANNQKFDKKKVKENEEKDMELERIEKIPFNANDLMVITVVKKLDAFKAHLKYSNEKSMDKLLSNLDKKI